MKKVMIGIFGAAALYFGAGLLFNLSYDYPPEIAPVQFASYELQTDVPKQEIEKQVSAMPEISACSFNPDSKLLTVFYFSEKTQNPAERIMGACGSTLKETQIEGNGAGAACPYHAFMDGLAPYFDWSALNMFN